MKKPIGLKLTAQGLQDLENEQDELIARRPGVLVRLVAAREQGDLSENAGYHAAKEELGRIDSRLRMLRLMIRSAEVVFARGVEVVSFGCNVVVSDGKGERQFNIVSALEADPAAGKMSDISPIGSALIGKKVGQSVDISVPDGKVRYKVVRIGK